MKRRTNHAIRTELHELIDDLRRNVLEIRARTTEVSKQLYRTYILLAELDKAYPSKKKT